MCRYIELKVLHRNVGQYLNNIENLKQIQQKLLTENYNKLFEVLKNVFTKRFWCNLWKCHGT